MSGLGDLIDAALCEVGPVEGRLCIAVVQRRVPRRLLAEAATSFRRAAALLDEAAALLPDPSPRGNDTSD